MWILLIFYVGQMSVSYWQRSCLTSTGERQWLGTIYTGNMKHCHWTKMFKLPHGICKLRAWSGASIKRIYVPAVVYVVQLWDGSHAPAHLLLPQPDRSIVPMWLYEVLDAAKCWAFLHSSRNIHCPSKGKEKERSWPSRQFDHIIAARKCVWLLFFVQIYPGILGTCGCDGPSHIFNKMIWHLYCRILPVLGVNWCIISKFRTPLCGYQGLGLPNFVVIAFVEKVHFLENNLGRLGSTGGMTWLSFRAFLLEIGPQGNILLQSWETLQRAYTMKTFGRSGTTFDLKSSLIRSTNLTQQGNATNPWWVSVGKKWVKDKLPESFGTLRKYRNVVH